MIARADALRGEVVGELRGPVVGLRVGEPAVAAHEGLVVGDLVDHPLPQVGQVELQVPCPPGVGQKKSVPPSTGTVAPTTKLHSSEQRKTTMVATSSGSPTRPTSFDAP